MTRGFSIYLDLVRFSAALLVVIHHSNQRVIIEQSVPFSGMGNSAVMVFFVLSGFVIAYVTANKENLPSRYAVSRLARIYPVAVAAVLLTLALDLAGKQIAPTFYATSPHDLWYVRIASSLLFTNELWFASIQSFSNVPYWSLNYEVWYYIIFGVFVFSKPSLRWPLCAALLVLVGPKIALLFPVWLIGVWTFHTVERIRIPEPAAWLLVAASLFGLWLYHDLDIIRMQHKWLLGVIGPYWHRELTSSGFFLAAYLLAGLMAMNFIGMYFVADRLSPALRAAEKPIRFLASFTFTLYLLHVPLIKFFATVIDGDPAGYGYYAGVMAGVFGGTYLVGSFTEHKKTSARRFFEAVLARARDALPGKV